MGWGVHRGTARKRKKEHNSDRGKLGKQEAEEGGGGRRTGTGGEAVGRDRDNRQRKKKEATETAGITGKQAATG